jgi:hypothetical protein
MMLRMMVKGRSGLLDSKHDDVPNSTQQYPAEPSSSQEDNEYQPDRHYCTILEAYAASCKLHAAAIARTNRMQAASCKLSDLLLLCLTP